MNLEKLASLALRVVFVGSLVLMGMACLERVVNFFDYTILPEPRYSPARMIEFATSFLIVVIALLLREVRDELRSARK